MSRADAPVSSRGRRLRVVFALGSLLAITTRCASPTEVVVDVYTEVDCTKSATAALVVGPTLAALRSSGVTSTLSACAPSTQRSGRVVLSPSGERDAPIAFQVVTRNDAEDPERTCTGSSTAGCIIARRQLRFVPGASTRVDVALRLSCVDKPCAPEETCRNGLCEGAAVREDCLGGACLDAPPAEGSPDAGSPSEAGVATEDASVPPPDAVDVPARVYAGSGLGYLIQGLAAHEGGLFWIEGTNNRSLPTRMVKAHWEDLGALELVEPPPNTGIGVTIDANGGGLSLGLTGPNGCALVFNPSAELPCGVLGFATTGGIARGNGKTYLLGTIGGAPTYGWFTTPAGGLDGTCPAPGGSSAFLEAEGTLLYHATGAGIEVRSIASGGCPGPPSTLFPTTAFTGVAVAPENEIICGGHPTGIDCVGAVGPTSPIRVATARPPTGDLALRAIGAARFVYYGAGSELWVVRIR